MSFSVSLVAREPTPPAPPRVFGDAAQAEAEASMAQGSPAGSVDDQDGDSPLLPVDIGNAAQDVALSK